MRVQSPPRKAEVTCGERARRFGWSLNKEHPVIDSRWFRGVVPILLLALAVAACESTPKRSDGQKKPAADAKDEKPVRIMVPRQCVRQLNEYVGRKMMVLADRIEIDASSDPFFGTIVMTADPRVIEKTQAVDAGGMVSMIRLRNRSNSLLERDLPQIRVGDGLGVIATREIIIRFHNKVTPARPMYFDLIATGSVVFDDPTYAVRNKSQHLSMRLSVGKVDDGYMFMGKVE
jgi:hypothetical protein